MNKLTDEIAAAHLVKDYNTWNRWLPDPDQIINKLKGPALYQELTLDTHVYSVIEQRNAGTLKLNWEIYSGDNDKHTDFVRDIFDKLDTHQITNNFLNCIYYGMSVNEIYWVKQSGYWIPENIQEKPFHWFKFSNERELLFKPKTNSNDGIKLPDNKFIICRHKPTYENPYGERALKRCFWPVTFKKGGWKFWVRFTEKYGSPALLGKLPRSSNELQQNELLNMLYELIGAGAGVIPDDGSIEALQVDQKSSVDAYRFFIRELNSEISKAILTQTLTTEIQDTGSYAASQTHSEKLDDLVTADSRLVKRAFNELIKAILTVNFGDIPGKLPFFEMYPDTDVDKILAERDKILVESGVRFKKTYWAKAYNIDEADFEVQESIVGNKPETFADEGFNLNLILPKVLLNKQGDSLVKPVLELVRNTENIDELELKLAQAVPELDTTQIRELLTKIIFIADLSGRV